MSVDWENLSDRDRAEIELALVDADVARWFVHDGQLSTRPLDRRELDGLALELRHRRMVAVAALEDAGGSDPHPAFLQEPTKAQREGNEARLRLVRAAADMARDRSMTLNEAVEALRRAW